MTVPTELDRRFRTRAAQEGLVDVAYELTDSPLGTLLVAATPAGVCAVSFRGDADETLLGLSHVHGPRVLRLADPVEPALRELHEYFDGARHEFDLTLDLHGVAPFQRAVLEGLLDVPYGGTATYGELAARIGRPGAARAVGGALNRNPLPIILPCHRVVGAGGKLVGYGGGLERKERLLALEGISL
ncbi:MAG: methylated-DNA--[protein]-cysteine S-methyltransferase [Gaiellales bacterium]